MRTSLLRFFAGLLVIASILARADVPMRINYQGYLATSGGQPVSASLQMTFGLYAASSGGAALWSETQTVPVANGIYNVSLGTVTPITLAFDAPYFLGVAVGADAEMTPRQPLASVPYAIRAGCNPGDRLSCYSGGSGPPGSGCALGTRVCNSAGTGWGACDGEVAPNCGGNCVNLQADTGNCGACGNACILAANGSPTCTAGTCGLACNVGFKDCNVSLGDGCETNVTVDLNNCGNCGFVCPTTVNVAARSCSNGTCGIGACNGGFADCNGIFGDGCEVNKNADPDNCGNCGAICPSPPNVSYRTCNNSVCGIGPCNAGFKDCNANPADGCEINVNADFYNCGLCGTVCAGGQSCVSGVCQ